MRTEVISLTSLLIIVLYGQIPLKAQPGVAFPSSLDIGDRREIHPFSPYFWSLLQMAASMKCCPSRAISGEENCCGRRKRIGTRLMEKQHQRNPSTVQIKIGVKDELGKHCDQLKGELY